MVNSFNEITMRTQKSIAVSLLLFLFFLTTSCISEKNEPEIDNEIVLKIGPIEINRYEYEKDKKREFEYQKFRTTEDWNNYYIANSYFLADAYYKKYDTISAITKVVDYAAITMLGKHRGYLWNKVEEPKLVISNKEIRKVYRKQNKILDMEYFLFPNKIVLNAILNNDTCIQTEVDFNKLIDTCHTKSVKYVNTQLVYPFNELESVKTQIYALQQGDIIKIPLKNGKILIAHLKKIIEINQKTFGEERENIYANLRRIKEKQIIEKKQNLILSKANIIINEKVANSILLRIENDKYLELSKTLLADTVLTYVFNNTPVVLSEAEFFDYYQNNPFMYVITEIESLKEVLRSIIIEKYLYTECVEIGITEETKFLTDKRDFMNRLILNAYNQNNFYKSKISNKDMIEYYNANKQKFTQCKTCYVSVFTFKDKNSAYYSLNFLDKIIFQNGILNPSDTSNMGLRSYHPKVIIETSNSDYQPELIRMIFTSKINTPIGPVKINNQESIFIKTKEEGQEIQPYEQAKETIEKQLITENMEIIKDNKLKELMNNHPIKINKIQKEK